MKKQTQHNSKANKPESINFELYYSHKFAASPSVQKKTHNNLLIQAALNRRQNNLLINVINLPGHLLHAHLRARNPNTHPPGGEYLRTKRNNTSLPQLDPFVRAWAFASESFNPRELSLLYTIFSSLTRLSITRPLRTDRQTYGYARDFFSPLLSRYCFCSVGYIRWRLLAARGYRARINYRWSTPRHISGRKPSEVPRRTPPETLPDTHSSLCEYSQKYLLEYMEVPENIP